MKINRKITVIVEGESEADVEYAFNEAFLRMVGGCTSGKDSNETSAFWFENNPATEPTIYIVVEGGCVQYVSSLDPNINVNLVDLDDLRNGMGGSFYSVEDVKKMQETLATAQGLTRIW